MRSQAVLAISLCGFVILSLRAVHLHQQSSDMHWPTAVAEVVDVNLTSSLDNGGSQSGPSERIFVTPTVQYRVGKQSYTRRLAPEQYRSRTYVTLPVLRSKLIGRRQTVVYDPAEPGNPPPISWQRLTAWATTATSVLCLVPICAVILRSLCLLVDAPEENEKGRRVLSANEYRTRERGQRLGES